MNIKMFMRIGCEHICRVGKLTGNMNVMLMCIDFVNIIMGYRVRMYW